MIYFLRHGETDFNKYNISQGQLDTSLNIKGLKQAKEVAEQLKNQHFDMFFCSTLTRARQTAFEVNKYHGLNIIYDERLMEVSKGSLQGNRNKQEVYDEFFKDPHKFGGETEEDVFNRVSSFLKDLESFRGKEILIVGHGGIHKYFLFCLQNMDIKKNKLTVTSMENCTVEKFEF